jgi:hypothetical protein
MGWRNVDGEFTGLNAVQPGAGRSMSPPGALVNDRPRKSAWTGSRSRVIGFVGAFAFPDSVGAVPDGIAEVDDH